MRNFILAMVVCAAGAIFASCDLQPKITSIPDSVGDFISARYPALLADPNTEPDIYNSAARDYGVYASPEIYGSSDTGDYVNYAGVDDYVMPGDDAVEEETDDTELSDDSDNTTPTEPDEEPEEESTETPKVESPDPDIIDIPEYKTDEIYVPARAAVGTVIVRRGDTLYAIARANNMTLDEIAKMNNLSAPYTIRTGQVLKIKSDMSANKAPEVSKKDAAQVVKETPKPETKPEVKPEPKPKPETKSAAKVEPKKAEPEKPKVEPAPKSEPKVQKDVRVPVKQITVARGDTLYSISRAYSVPVNDLAVMNGLTAPFALSVGQKLRVPDLPARTTEVVKKPVASGTKDTVKKTDSKPAVKADTAKKPDTVKKAETKKAEAKKTETKKADVKKQDTKKPETKKVETKKADKTATKKTTTDTKKATKQNTEVQKIAARSSSKFSWPVRGTILSHYGAKEGGLYNDGINIGAALNTPVVAAENGVVAYAGNEVRGMGNLIIIQHADGWMTVYGHMSSMTVRRGARVSVGQKIGAVGKSGRIAKPQLHFEIRKGTKAYNPINYLKK